MKSDLLELVGLLDSQREADLHVGAQIYVSQNGETLLDEAIGESVPGRALERDDLMAWYSSSKPVTAVAILQLWEQGRLGLDDRVSNFIGGWGSGKERATIRHLLTHTGGFAMLINEPLDQRLTFAETTALIAAHPAEYEPGTKAGYHATTGMHILGAIVEAVDSRPIEKYVREEIFAPAAMDSCRLGISLEEQEVLGDRIAPVHWRGNVALVETAGEIHEFELRSDKVHNEPWFLAKVEPGATGRGPARELAKFYESLLGFGPQLLTPATVETMRAAHRWGMRDLTLGVAYPWGLGVALEPAIPGGTGRRAFGHGGMASSRFFADPECGLVFAVITNGLAAPIPHEDRMFDLTNMVYELLGSDVAHLRAPARRVKRIFPFKLN